MPFSALHCCLAALLLASCQDPPAPFLRLERTLPLPKQLREISGIAWDGKQLLGVQDELGKVFTIGDEGEVVTAERFGPKADYEDLAIVGDRLFVLRSDGMLLELARGAPDKVIAEVLLDVPEGAPEYESIAHDPRRQRLLFAPKVDLKDKRQDPDRRSIFAFDLQTRRPLPEPVLELSLRAVEARAAALGVALPLARSGKGQVRTDLQLRISALAVQPQTDRVWVLSATDRVLLTATLRGEIERVHCFAASELPQPEGLCFAAPGQLWIASEAGTKPAKLCRFGIGPPR